MNKTYVKIFEEIEYYQILYAGDDQQIAKGITIHDVNPEEYIGSEDSSHILQIWEGGKLKEVIHTDSDGNDIDDETD
ncbi:hypothetical protein SAMN04487895_101568 [Paenibacillus sophorae]|uniref:Uncharacterized protein n=1 Tax=Paenibacillus sophorae TaxID=1333845 RepID=A0A1H8GMP5_9BACL|nr:hypothetical protein [Paenibacillus sophorae]QWU14271.1 hypothetical protein KP014_20400 [Paenibacillus sophorae]SEN45014.1 hypothetical protein SAMN04487895_101568 [Paenibacillus sophorae]